MPPVTSQKSCTFKYDVVHVDQYEYLVEFSFSPTRLEIDTSAMALNRLLSTLGKNKTRPSTVLRTSVLTKSPDLGVTLLTSLHAPGTITTALLAEVALVHGQTNEPPGAHLRVGLTALLSFREWRKKSEAIEEGRLSVSME